MRVGIDVDGVLADFNTAFAALCAEVNGEDLIGDVPGFPAVWHWSKHYGYSRKVVKDIWKRIDASSVFWEELQPLPDIESLLQLPDSFNHDIYFITARSGVTVKRQTERWLDMHGWDSATVLISGEKGLCAAALDLDLYVDDRLENIHEVVKLSPRTQAFLIDRPYNHSTNDAGFTRVATLKKALEYAR